MLNPFNTVLITQPVLNPFNTVLITQPVMNTTHEVLLPDVCDGVFVLVVSCPDGDLVPFGADVDDGSAHIVAVLVKRFPHQTEDLQHEITLNTIPTHRI